LTELLYPRIDIKDPRYVAWQYDQNPSGPAYERLGRVNGKVVGQYTLFGKEFEFHSRWTATLVKENGRWLLASYHVSLNALDNPLINSAKKSLIWAAVGTGVAGLLVGLLIGRRKKA